VDPVESQAATGVCTPDYCVASLTRDRAGGCLSFVHSLTQPFCRRAAVVDGVGVVKPTPENMRYERERQTERERETDREKK